MVPPSILAPVTRDPALAAAIVGGLRDVEATFAQQLRSDLPAVNELAQHVERYRGKMLRPTLVIVSGLAFTRDGAELRAEHEIVAAAVHFIEGDAILHVFVVLLLVPKLCLGTQTGSEPRREHRSESG